MLPQVNALPLAEREATSGDRDRKMDAGQRRANVRGHVVRALVAVPEEWIAVGHETGEEAIQIPARVGICILLHDKARRRMANEQRQDTLPYLAAGRPLGDGTSDFQKSAAASLEVNCRAALTKHRRRIIECARRLSVRLRALGWEESRMRSCRSGVFWA